MNRIEFALVTVFLASLTTSCGSSGMDGSESSKTSATDINAFCEGKSYECLIESLIVKEVNALRKKDQTLNLKASWVARDWSMAMAKRGGISHDGFPAERDNKLHSTFPEAKWLFGAENVAAFSAAPGKSPDKVARDAANLFWNSPSHRANMLADFNNTGVGVFFSNGMAYVTQNFYN